MTVGCQEYDDGKKERWTPKSDADDAEITEHLSTAVEVGPDGRP